MGTPWMTGLGQTDMKKITRPSGPSAPLPQGIKEVRRFLAVASGKGGVGKTTVAANLALALARQGHRVGLLDADIYGPSVPLMLDLHEQPEIEQGKIVPLEKFSLRIMSIGFMTDAQQPVVWRGPLVARAIRDFLDKVQ
jgi:ATP-binding protein involved in chromosome partitioning